MINLKIYHGSTVIVEKPSLEILNYRTDFGKENGIYDIEETIKRLKTYLLSNQISFHTLKSLECIKYIETIEVGEEDE